MATIGYLALKKIYSQGTSPSFNATDHLTLLGTKKLSRFLQEMDSQVKIRFVHLNRLLIKKRIILVSLRSCQ